MLSRLSCSRGLDPLICVVIDGNWFFFFFFSLPFPWTLRAAQYRALGGPSGDARTEREGEGGEGEDNLFILCLKWSLHSCMEFSLFISGQLIHWLIIDSIGVTEIDCRAALWWSARRLWSYAVYKMHLKPGKFSSEIRKTQMTSIFISSFAVVCHPINVCSDTIWYHVILLLENSKLLQFVFCCKKPSVLNWWINAAGTARETVLLCSLKANRSVNKPSCKGAVALGRQSDIQSRLLCSLGRVC